MESNKQRRLSTEKNINNEFFRLKIGTVNKSDPRVIYYEGRTFISPNEYEDSYNHSICYIKKRFSTIISDEIRKSELFDKNFILDFQVANSGIKEGKKSFLSFQVLLRQPNTLVRDLKTINKEALPFITNILNNLKEEIFNVNFSLSKVKKEPFNV